MIQGVCDIYPHKICSWDICPGKRIWTKIYYWLIFLLNHFFYPNFLGGWIFSGANIYCNKSFLEWILLDQHFFNPKLFAQHFFGKFFWQVLFDQNFSRTDISLNNFWGTIVFWDKHFLDQNFWEQNLLGQRIFGATFCWDQDEIFLEKKFSSAPNKP